MYSFSSKHPLHKAMDTHTSLVSECKNEIRHKTWSCYF